MMNLLKKKKDPEKKISLKENMKKIFSKKHLKEIFTGEENRKYLRHGSYSSAMTVVVIAVVVVVNLIVAQLPSDIRQIDVSTQKLYSVTDDTKEILKNLDTDVTLYYIARNGSEDDTIEKLLEHYEDLSSHITVEQKDPDLYPKFTSQYTSEQVASDSVIVVSGEKSKVVSGDDMWESSIDYSTYSYKTTGFDGEGQITSAISYVTSENNAKIYWVTGHGEPSISDLTSNFSDAIEKSNIDVEELALMTEEIPEDTSCIVIMAPSVDFSQEEANKVISYMENGGNVLMFTNYSDTDMPNIDSILENYGVTRSDGVVVESDSQYYYPQMPYYLLPEIQSDDITEDVKDNYILMPVAQAILPLDSYRDTLTITSLLQTTDGAYIEDDPDNSTWSKSEDSVTGTFDLGVVITETVDDKEAKLIYFSCANMLSSQIDMAVSGANAKLAASAAASMCDVEESVLIASKSLSYSSLVFTDAQVSFWSIVTIGLIPVSVIVIGLVIWMRRRKR
ncbi:MAG: GldG family protein [Fusicatenibacter sp.]|nr:GldG family protein [Fusicatenibacter sp.]